MRNKLALTAASLSAAALLAGCSVGSGVEPPAQPPSSAANMHGAPKVQNPLETKAFQQQPCSVLKPEQINALNMQQWQPEADMESVGGPSCGWDYMGGPPDYTVSGNTVTFMVKGSGLKGIYPKRETFSYFRELKPIGGYPAVAAGTTGGGTPEEAGSCDVGVGVTNDLVVLIQTSLGNGSPYAGDPCGRAQRVATEVVKTLKAGA